MLFVSTRNKDTFTALRAIYDQTAPDGGVFMPHQVLPLPKNELLRLYKTSFHEICAYILNQLLATKLTATDIEYCAGRNIVSFHTMNRKIIVAELWRNLDSAYSHIEKALYYKITDGRGGPVPVWVRIAVRTAIIFAIYVQQHNNGVGELDIAVYGSDCTGYLAAYYARLLGLPIKTIIIGCDERSGIWDLVHKGEFPAAGSGADAEPFIYSVLGYSETVKFLDAYTHKKNYYVDDELISKISEGLFAAVIGQNRRESVVSSVWRTNGYVIDTDTAVAYSALQDFRSRTGVSRDTLLFADRNPLADAARIQNATHLSAEQLGRLVSLSRE